MRPALTPCFFLTNSALAVRSVALSRFLFLSPAAQPSLWVDMQSFEVVRIDRGDGVRFRFGPTSDFGSLRLPSWISIEAPGQPPARLEIVKGVPANAPAASFSTEWLLGPTGSAGAAASP